MQGKQPRDFELEADKYYYVEGGVLNHDVGPEATGINHDTGRGRRTRGGAHHPLPHLIQRQIQLTQMT